MEEVTIILFIGAMLCFALGLAFQMYGKSSRVLSSFTLILAVCGLSATVQDTSLADNIVYLVAFPMISVALFAIGDLCIIKELK